jgi:peptidoglycan DL-endopeptidase CwlO
VTHSTRLTTCYAHLSRIDVQLGARVATVNVLGAVGCTGHCFGDHLHFETRQGADRFASATDPTGYLET